MNTQSIPADTASKHAFWQRHISEYHNSNTSAAQYCRDQGLSYHAFKNWQKKFSTKGKPSKSSKVQPKKFVRIQTPPPFSTPALMKCRFPNGLELSWDASSTSAVIVSAIIQEVGRL